jgi:hypothetical protein
MDDDDDGPYRYLSHSVLTGAPPSAGQGPSPLPLPLLLSLLLFLVSSLLPAVGCPWSFKMTWRAGPITLSGAVSDTSSDTPDTADRASAADESGAADGKDTPDTADAADSEDSATLLNSELKSEKSSISWSGPRPEGLTTTGGMNEDAGSWGRTREGMTVATPAEFVRTTRRES